MKLSEIIIKLAERINNYGDDDVGTDFNIYYDRGELRVEE